MSYDDDIITELTSEECWDALRTDEFGRLAYHLGDEIGLVPVNYAVDGGRIIFSSAEGSKLLGVVMDKDVAFEIDLIDDEAERAWSVVARGAAQLLEGQQARDTDNLRLRPWVDEAKYNVVAITVTEISGWEFRLARPWRHMVPDEDEGR